MDNFDSGLDLTVMAPIPELDKGVSDLRAIGGMKAPKELNPVEMQIATAQSGDAAGAIFNQADDSYKTEDLAKFMVKKFGPALKYVPEHLKTKDVCKEACIANGTALQYVPDALKDKEMCLYAARRSGSWQYIPDAFKDQETAETYALGCERGGQNVLNIFFEDACKRNGVQLTDDFLGRYLQRASQLNKFDIIVRKMPKEIANNLKNLNVPEIPQAQNKPAQPTMPNPQDPRDARIEILEKKVADLSLKVDVLIKKFEM